MAFFCAVPASAPASRMWMVGALAGARAQEAALSFLTLIDMAKIRLTESTNVNRRSIEKYGGSASVGCNVRLPVHNCVFTNYFRI